MKKRNLLLFAAGLALTAGNVMADDKPAASMTPAAAPASQEAPKTKSSNPTIAAIQAAIDLDAAGNTTAAVAAFEKITTKTKNLECWRLTDEANVYLKVDDNAKAVSLLEAATTANDKNYVSWNNLGTAYENSGDLDKAKDAYQKSIDTAKDASASSAKAEGNLEALQARLDKQAAKDAKKNGGKPAAAATPAAK